MPMVTSGDEGTILGMVIEPSIEIVKNFDTGTFVYYHVATERKSCPVLDNN